MDKYYSIVLTDDEMRQLDDGKGWYNEGDRVSIGGWYNPNNKFFAQFIDLCVNNDDTFNNWFIFDDLKIEFPDIFKRMINHPIELNDFHK